MIEYISIKFMIMIVFEISDECILSINCPFENDLIIQLFSIYPDSLITILVFAYIIIAQQWTK